MLFFLMLSFAETFSCVVKQAYNPNSQNSLTFVSFSLMTVVICVIKFIMFKYSKTQAEERLGFGFVKVY